MSWTSSAGYNFYKRVEITNLGQWLTVLFSHMWKIFGNADWLRQVKADFIRQEPLNEWSNPYGGKYDGGCIVHSLDYNILNSNKGVMINPTSTDPTNLQAVDGLKNRFITIIGNIYQTGQDECLPGGTDEYKLNTGVANSQTFTVTFFSNEGQSDKTGNDRAKHEFDSGAHAFWFWVDDTTGNLMVEWDDGGGTQAAAWNCTVFVSPIVQA